MQGEQYSSYIFDIVYHLPSPAPIIDNTTNVPLICNRGLPLSTYASRGVGGVKPPIHFHCVVHAQRGWVGPDSM